MKPIKIIFFAMAVGAVCLLLTGCSAFPAAATVNTANTAAPQGPKFFSTAAECAACHANLKDSQSADISFTTFWQSSLHANAALDPYYLASVRREITQYVTFKDTIQDECGRCHLPMANLTAHAKDQSTAFLDEGFNAAQHPLNALYKDGVSCTACHQIQPTGADTAASFSGAFQVDLKTPSGARLLYGPYNVEQALLNTKQSATGYIATQSDHLGKSEFCATCHMLYTSPVTKEGKLSDVKFPEQMPYLEWQQSSMAGKVACQSCHMTQVNGDAKISILNSPPRSDVKLHAFTGANLYMITLLKQNAEELGVTATAAQLDAAVQRTQEQLQKRSAVLEVSSQTGANQLTLTVKVTNQAGHKLPTAFPSRRVWLHVTVKDGQGQPIFESGGWKENGAINGNANDDDQSSFEPHFDLISQPDQVQIYEPILGNLDGKVTTGVVDAAKYLKDNRLLPAGFDKSKSSPDAAVVGEALADANFTGGTDQVKYQVALQGAQGPFTADVELVYQSMGYRWLNNFAPLSMTEPGNLMRMTSASPNIPVILASQKVEIDLK